MFGSLPSLPSLRTFEAAARRGSFKAAAEELAVTPTAVSHQIRSLEEALGTALFVRRTRAVDLTAAGQVLFPAVNAGLTSILDAWGDLRSAEQVITVTTIPAFATLRLVPALRDFERRNPDLSVRIDTGTGVVDLRRDRRFDVAIRYGQKPYPELHDTALIEETFGAYVAPSQAEAFADLSAASLIETEWRQPGLDAATWEMWFARAGLPARGRTSNMFDEELFVMQSAIAGQGVALLSSALVGDAVERGLLIPVCPEVTLPGIGYRALCLPERAETPKVRTFLRWLTETFGSGRGAPEGERAAVTP